LSLKTIKTCSPRREVATFEQLGRHERKAVGGVLVRYVSMVAVGPDEIAKINAITEELAFP
jgi:hypothetical protein